MRMALAPTPGAGLVSSPEGVNPPALYAERQNLDVVVAVDLMGPIPKDAAVACPVGTSAGQLLAEGLGAVEAARLVVMGWQPMRHSSITSGSGDAPPRDAP